METKQISNKSEQAFARNQLPDCHTNANKATAFTQDIELKKTNNQFLKAHTFKFN